MADVCGCNLRKGRGPEKWLEDRVLANCGFSSLVAIVCLMRRVVGVGGARKVPNIQATDQRTSLSITPRGAGVVGMCGRLLSESSESTITVSQ